MTRLWIVRAGRHGERELAAIEQSRLLPGFTDVGDLSGKATREEIAASLREVMPDVSDNGIRNFAAQLNQFVHKIAIGDLVVMPRKVTNGVAIGRVTGDYTFDADASYRHYRPVEW